MTSTMSMAMTSSTGTMAMAMSSATSTSGTMDGMPMPMPMSMMSMTFFYSLMTPLFSTAWTPSNTGQYAGTCIFLIVLAIVHRGIAAFRSAFFAHTHLPGHATASDIEKEKAVVRFNAGRELARGILEAISGGIGYLLMIGVMTMNVGYFSSVIAGLFLGGFLLGRFDGTPGYC